MKKCNIKIDRSNRSELNAEAQFQKRVVRLKRCQSNILKYQKSMQTSKEHISISYEKRKKALRLFD